MTLNDLDWPFRVKFCFRAGLAGWDRATSENNCVKTNKDRHTMSPVFIFGKDSSFWQYKAYAGIRRGSLERRLETTAPKNQLGWLSDYSLLYLSAQHYHHQRLKPISQLRFHYDTTTTRLRRKIGMLVFRSRRIASNGSRRARYIRHSRIVVESQL